MNEVLTLTLQIVKLAIVMAIGFIIVKTKYVGEDFLSAVSKLISKVTLPLMIFASITSPEITPQDIYEGWPIILVTILYIFIALGISYSVGKALKLEKKRFATFFSLASFCNVLFMGAPLLIAVYGESTGMLNASLTILAQNTVLWTFGMYMIGKAGGEQKSAKENIKKLFNFLTISMFAALALKLLNVTIPDLIYAPIEGLGSSTPYLSMLFLGMTMATTKFRDVVKDRDIYIFTVLKGFVLPAFFMFVTYGVFGFMLTPVQQGSVMIETATSPMTSLVPIIKENGLDYKFAGPATIICVIVNIFFIPLLMYLTKILF